MHATGIAIIAVALRNIRFRLESRRHPFGLLFVMSVAIIAAVGLLLAALHGIECLLWAMVYLLLAAIESPRDAILYSIDSMTTRGASGLTLEQQWRIMGALEAADGMLLFGISTASIFALMQWVWSMLLPAHRSRLRAE